MMIIQLTKFDGRVEYQAQMGALITDITLIKLARSTWRMAGI